MEDRFNRVYNYMLGRGFRVTHGVLSRPLMVDVPTMDVDCLTEPGAGYSWVPYDAQDPREKVWALIMASRIFITKYEQFLSDRPHQA